VNITEKFIPSDCNKGVSLVDSLPIVACKGRNRKGKVARELADKRFCSTKGMYYYGLKLHALGFCRNGRIPFPERLLFTPVSVNDLRYSGRASVISFMTRSSLPIRAIVIQTLMPWNKQTT